MYLLVCGVTRPNSVPADSEIFLSKAYVLDLHVGN